jgi:hypothetical protein
MSTSVLGLFIFIAVALVGWGIGTLKYRNMPYTNNEEEKEVEANEKEQFKKSGYKELSIRDILKMLTYKGYSAY